MLKLKRLNKAFAAMVMSLVMLFSVFPTTPLAYMFTNDNTIALATVGGGGSGALDGPQNRLRERVDQRVHGNHYTAEDGRTFTGNRLVQNGIVTAAFTELSRSEQDRLIRDMNDAVLELMAEDADNPGQTDPVLQGTRTSWMNTMMAQQGVVGSTFAFLEDGLAADFLAAQRILGPLYPIISQVLALCILASMFIIFINFGIDIFAMATPAVQQKVLANGGGGNQGSGGVGQIAAGAKNKGNGAGIANFVSLEATIVIKEAVESGNGSLGGMIVKYMMKRIFGLLAFIVFVVIVATGNLMSVLGTMIDMVARMMGF